MKYLVRTFLLISGVFLLATSCSGDGEEPTLSYGTTSYSFPVNTEITPITATLKGDTPTGCYASPVLPNGLLLDQRTCTISGTPETIQSATTHTVTASNDYGSDNATISIEITIASGYTVTETAGGVQFNMAYIPGGLTFPASIDDSTTSSVSNDYYIGETEVTYGLWYTVYQWAVSNGYTFANAGIEGNDGTVSAAPATQEPVTTISWRDAMVWTNALTEYYNVQNGTSLECVYNSDSLYTICIRDSLDGAYGLSVNMTPGSFDNPYVNANATGFRLPTADEWEFAARYIGDANGDGDILDAGEYYPGNYASGADAAYGSTASSDYDGDGNIYSTDDVAWYSGNTSYTNDVQIKPPNALGLYDMSGNVYEWVFDFYPTPADSYRLIFGGSWTSSSEVRIGDRESCTPSVEDTPPYIEYSIIGFRLARTP